MIKLIKYWLSKYPAKFKLNISILVCACLFFLSLILIIFKPEDLSRFQIIIGLLLLICILLIINCISHNSTVNDKAKIKEKNTETPTSTEVSTIILEANIKKIEALINYLKNNMQKYGLSEKAQFNMIMASEEIFSNIAQYAYSKDKKATVTIKTELAKDIYSITFIDTGKKYNPLENKMPDITTDLKNKQIGGLGIFLTKKLTDTQNYVYANKQNILSVGIDIHK